MQLQQYMYLPFLAAFVIRSAASCDGNETLCYEALALPNWNASTVENVALQLEWPTRLYVDEPAVFRAIPEHTKVRFGDGHGRENANFSWNFGWSRTASAIPVSDARIGGSPPDDITYTNAPASIAAGIFTIEPETGLIFAMPKQEGDFTMWLVLEDGAGRAIELRHPKEMDQVLIARWDVKVAVKEEFEVTEYSYGNKTRKEYLDAYQEATGHNGIFAVGIEYRLEPITIIAATGNFNGPKFEKIRFTVEGGPKGVLIDPKDGYIQGTPHASQNGTYTMKTVATDGDGARDVVSQNTFQIRAGPKGKPCLNNGKIVGSLDDGSTSFTCECNQTKTDLAKRGFNGTNCEVDIAKMEAEATAKTKTEEAANNLETALASAKNAKEALAKAEESAEVAAQKTIEAQASAKNATEALAQALEATAAQKSAEQETVAAQAASKQTTTISAGAAGGAIILILAIIGAIKYRQHQIAMQPVDFSSIFNLMVERGDISTEQIQIMADRQGRRTSTFDRALHLPREIPRRCITKSEKVGEGAFGEVFKGILDETSNNNGVPGYMVACKSVTDPTGDGAADLLQEATVMAQIGSHANLVSLIGVVTSGVPLLIIIALCENGSLKSQLEKRVLGEGKLVGKPGALPPKIDADIGVEIARGMQHLVDHHLVHRDLAARNVLLDSQLVAKVADFGLSRAFSEGGDYYKSTAGMMALRWTAPEAMTTLKFSMKTDVWAFGIVLLEIAINGELPIKELTNAEIMAQMQSGYQTPKPRGCSAGMYDIMCKCWALDPSERPTFADLDDMLSGDDVGEVSATDNAGTSEATPLKDAVRSTAGYVGYTAQPLNAYSTAETILETDTAGYVVKGDAKAQAARFTSIALYSTGAGDTGGDARGYLDVNDDDGNLGFAN